MLKKSYEWKFWKHFILSFCIVLVTFISSILAKQLFISKVFIGLTNKFSGFNIGDVASIGIIGASDGPTSILVNNINITRPWMLLYQKLILFVILLLMYLPIKACIKKLNRKDDDMSIS